MEQLFHYEAYGVFAEAFSLKGLCPITHIIYDTKICGIVLII